MKTFILKAATLGLLFASVEEVEAVKSTVQAKAQTKTQSSALSEANILAVAESMAKAKLRAKSFEKNEQKADQGMFSFTGIDSLQQDEEQSKDQTNDKPQEQQ